MAINYSEVYKIDTTATKDTLYDRDVVPVSTTNLKIPNPTVRTSFIPSGGRRRGTKRRRI